MSLHVATINWTRTSEDFTYKTYNREHKWNFAGGQEVSASAAPDYLGDPASVDPEEAFVASLASCHMLTFLAIACKKGFVVDGYQDGATGTLAKNEAGQLAMTEVVLKPEVSFGGDRQPTQEELDRLHESAHKHCFVANSVKTDVRVEQP